MSSLTLALLRASGQRLLQALYLTPGEIDDLAMFLRTLSIVDGRAG